MKPVRPRATRPISVRKALAAALLALTALPAAADEAELLRKLEALERETAELRRQLESLHQSEPAAAVAQPSAQRSSHDHDAHARGDGRPQIAGAGLEPLKLGTLPSANAFNPAISVIFDGFWHHDGVKGESGEIIEEAAGFHGHHDDDGHEHGSLKQGFNLAHTEIVMSASVDNYFDALLNLAVDEDGIEVEEAYGVTRNLPAGLQVKFGKFYSGVGYINAQHPHEWDFVDRPLPHHLMFGDHGLNDSGVQLTWVPPLPTYTLVGLELLQGDNEALANYVGETDSEPVAGALRERSGPRLVTGFIKVGPDLGPDHALQAGLFGGRASVHQELHDHGHGANYLEGSTWFAGTDWVWQYDRGGAHGHGRLRLQGEYLYRVKDLETAASLDEPAFAVGNQRRSTQDGLYVQGVYGIAPRWTTGLRYEAAGLTSRLDRPDGTIDYDDSRRISANVAWNPTEFSRLRLQWGRAGIAGDEGREWFNQFYLQYQRALGAHGAHKF
ncbi:MAG: TonB-dependent receptor [Ectothiorhodospiraceae bacterium]|jgi:hypothetical protein|nr:TonB-dependent receptor [Ectothiorhodospiraceae bacterium]